LLALTAMIALELPHVNILTKCDLMAEEDIDRMLSLESATQLWDMETYHRGIEGDTELEKRRQKRYRLTKAISSLLDDYTMVSFLPLNIMDEDSLEHVLLTVDHSVQFGENQEVNTEDYVQYQEATEE
jgi:hypothetical protein